MKWHYDAHCDVSIGYYKNVKIEWRNDDWDENNLYEAQYKDDTYVTETLEDMKRWIDKVVDGIEMEDECEGKCEVKPNDTQRLFLLVSDDYIGDYYLHAVFDDNKKSAETIKMIVANVSRYMVVKGTIIRDYSDYDGRS